MATRLFSDLVTTNGYPMIYKSPTGMYYACIAGSKTGYPAPRIFIYSSTDQINWTDMNFQTPDANKPQQFAFMEFDNDGKPIVVFFGQQTTTVTNLWWSHWTGSAWSSLARIYANGYTQTNAVGIKVGNNTVLSYVQYDSSGGTTIKMLFLSLTTFAWTTSPVTVSSNNYEYPIGVLYPGDGYYHVLSLGPDASSNFQVFHRKTANPTTTWGARTTVTSGSYQWNNVVFCTYGTQIMMLANRTDTSYSSKYVYYYWTYNGSTWTSRGAVNPHAYHTNRMFGLVYFSSTDIRCFGTGNTPSYPNTAVPKFSKWNGSSWNGWETPTDSFLAYNRTVGNVIKESDYVDYAFSYSSSPQTVYLTNTRLGQIVAREVSTYLKDTDVNPTKVQEAIKTMTTFAQTVFKSLNKIVEDSVNVDTYLNGLQVGLQKSAGTEVNVYSKSTNTNINKAINSNKNSNVYMAKAFVSAIINVLTDNVKTVTTYMEKVNTSGNLLVEVLSEVYANNVKVSSNKSVSADKLATTYMSNVFNYADKMKYKHMESTVFSEIANISILSYKLAELTINSYMNAVKTELEKTQVRTSEVDTFMNQLATEMEYQRVFGRIVTAYANESNLSLDIQIPGLNTNISTSSTGNTATITLHPDSNNVILNVGQSKLIVDDKVNSANVSTTSNKIIISVKEEN